MTHLLDTNALLDLLDPDVRTSLPRSAVTHVSAITQVELNHGVAAALARGTSSEASRRSTLLQKVLQTWVPVPVDADVATQVQRVAEAALSAGQNPHERMNDLMIAATASSRGWVLVTNDATLAAAVRPLVPVVPV